MNCYDYLDVLVDTLTWSLRIGVNPIHILGWS